MKSRTSILRETSTGHGGQTPSSTPAAVPVETDIAAVTFARIRANCQHAASGIDLDEHAGRITAMVLTAKGVA